MKNPATKTGASRGRAGGANTGTTLVVQGVSQRVTLCQCNRCGNIWKPRIATPARCPGCSSSLWNQERRYHRAGSIAPTQKPKSRGKAFQEGFDERRRHGRTAAKVSIAAPIEEQTAPPAQRATRRAKK